MSNLIDTKDCYTMFRQLTHSVTGKNGHFDYAYLPQDKGVKTYERNHTDTRKSSNENN
ncbi:MAG: hypothetical protein IJD40_07590 [Lachnospiraceae bacterium]|nr:hypothetical protein [Lachnospiraceae bacterium]